MVHILVHKNYCKFSYKKAAGMTNLSFHLEFMCLFKITGEMIDDYIIPTTIIPICYSIVNK